MKLISIVIPNYNRAHLIGETLDSILAQTYTNWECIIVDDVSTDNSVEVINNYIFKESRIKLFIRPINYPKGANACRNIGMSKSQGDYVIFFDSDDLMLENHIQKKLEFIQSGDYDFIVTKSEFFNDKEKKHFMNYREIDKLPITADNFITKKINWITFDPIIESSIAKSIKFIEKNESAEEYNYFVKLVLITEKAKFFNVILTKRRYHEDSYQVNLNNNQSKIALNQFYYYYDTYLEVKGLKISILSKKYLLDNAVFVFYRYKIYLKNIDKNRLYKNILSEYGFLKGINKIFQIERK